MNVATVEKRLIDHLKCSKCQCKACISCIKSVCFAMIKNNHHHNDKWFQNVNTFMKGNQQPTNFIGHCCEVGLSIDSAKKAMKDSEGINGDTELLFDGCLHIPGIHVLLPSLMIDYVDVHGLGREGEDDLPGLLHGVVNRVNAMTFYKRKLKPDGTMCKHLSHIVKSINCDNIYGKPCKYSCVIDTFMIDEQYNSSNKKHSCVSLEDVKGSRVLLQPEGNNIWIILAVPNVNSSSRQLVNIRWPSSISSKEYNSDVVKQLYKDTLCLLKHDGFEATRKGGSNGMTTYNNSGILSLLKTNSAFVRKGKGVKVVKGDTVWSCYYISAGGIRKTEHLKDRAASCWSYPPPQRGGQFSLNIHYMTKYLI